MGGGGLVSSLLLLTEGEGGAGGVHDQAYASIIYFKITINEEFPSLISLVKPSLFRIKLYLKTRKFVVSR